MAKKTTQTNFNENEASIQDFYEELMNNAEQDDNESRLRAASMIMQQCGDAKMSNVLNTLAAQMTFDDNKEAQPAIERTRAKLDHMIKERQDRHAMLYVKLMRDEEILNLSGGEVTEPDYDYLTSSFYKNGLFDPDIFGGSGKIPLYDDENDKIPSKTFGTGTGHIQLPVPVILEKDYSLIAQLLGMNTEDIQKVARYTCYLVLEPGKSKCKKYDVLPEKEYEDCSQNKGFIAEIGGNAIYKALTDLNLPDEPERLAFSVVPVASPMIRGIAYSKKEQQFIEHPLNKYYTKTVLASNRCRKLIDLGAPEIIIRNECRMLDETVNALVKSAQKYLSEIHWKKTGFHSFMYMQLKFILRERKFSIFGLDNKGKEKTGEIESLGIYPETIFEVKDGQKSPISLNEVIDHNNDIVNDYQMEHAIILPGDAKDEDLDDETKAEIKEIDDTIARMESYNDCILAAAMEQQEECTIRFDEKESMYTLIAG